MRLWRRAVVWVCLGWFSSCPYFDLGANNRPLAYGMTPQAAAAALNTQLIPLAGRRGSDVYYAEVPSSIPGFYSYQEQIWLEFRRGRLTGWNNDWQRRSLW